MLWVNTRAARRPAPLARRRRGARLVRAPAPPPPVDAPALGVTVYESGVNVAITVQLTVTGFVVYVVPTSVPPHVPVKATA